MSGLILITIAVLVAMSVQGYEKAVHPFLFRNYPFYCCKNSGLLRYIVIDLGYKDLNYDYF